jgi:hypothetical protein
MFQAKEVLLLRSLGSGDACAIRLYANPEQPPSFTKPSLYPGAALSMTKSELSRNPSLALFTISRPQKKRKAQPGGEAASPPACAIGALIGLHGQKFIFKNRG